ncbi:MAG: hypothetical protein ACM359_16490 [Bacillota bacterium]
MDIQQHEPAADVETGAEPQTGGFLRRVDSLAAMTSTLFLGLGVILLWCYVVADAGRHPGFLRLGITIALAMVGFVADICFVLLVLQAFFSHAPKLPAAVAVKQYLFPWPLRPILAAYWLLHFAGGAFMAVGMEVLMVVNRRDSHLGGGEIVFMMVLAYVFTYAANTYLLAAVAALTRNPRVLVITWRLRLLTDLVIAVGTPLLFGNVRPA